MSVTSPIRNDAGIVNTALGLLCFACALACGDPAIHWAGATGSSCLHPACLPDWVAALFVDYHKVTHPASSTNQGAAE